LKEASALETILSEMEFWKRFRGVIARLPPHVQEMFVRHCLCGENVREVAALLECSPYSVEQQLLRLRQRMRALLQRRGLTDRRRSVYLGGLPPVEWPYLPADDVEQ
jgi:DNA-directed RNA polymerase specialized sigma24 family protein